MHKIHHLKRPAAVVAASFLLVAGAAITAAPAAVAGTFGGTRASDRNCDFNGDGYEDVLTGAPGATVNGVVGTGYVTVQYGSSSGITTADRAVFHQATSGITGAGEAGDAFGEAVASGDIDADGYDDAIVGVPGEDVGAATDAGRVVVLWGSPDGLSGGASGGFQEETPAAGAAYGSALTAAHFTNDTPGDLLAVMSTDYVSLYWFTSAGVQRSADRTIAIGPPGVQRDGEDREIIPKSLTTGDYDANGYADLVVPGLTTGDEPGHGWSGLYAGHEDGLAYSGDLRGGPVAASGDLNGDGYDDLVTGEPHSPDDGGESVTGGLVGVYYGSPDGPQGTEPGGPPQWWTQDSAGVPGVVEQGDGWGTDLSVGDTNRDGYADLAIGASGEDIGTVADAGAVWLLRGSAEGLTSDGNRSYDQNSTDVPGDAEANDHFGGQVRLVDPNGDGCFGLLGAAPGENTGDGVVWVFSAGTGGLTAAGSWTYGGGSLGAPAADAAFGAAIDE